MTNSDTGYGKKDAASEALLEATALLAREQFQAMPTARDVAKKSGYSVGTLYRYFGSVGGTIAILAPYVRAFTEPYQEFMRLTAEGRPGPAGAQGTGVSIGPENFSAASNRNEQAILDATRFNTGLSANAGTAEHLGSYRFNAPLKEDVHVERNDPSYLKAFSKNPYAQPLNSF